MPISDDDTIASISSAPSSAAVGIIRISGPRSLPLLKRLCSAKKGGFVPNRIQFTRASHPKRGHIIDEVMAVYLKAPESFTGEDMAEIYCHGGIAVMTSVMDCLIALGARQAERGEFSKRAFLNGKIDLIKAEAIAALIGSKTQEGAHAAASQLGGTLSKRISEITDQLTAILALIEAQIDFPEEMGRTNIRSIRKTMLQQAKALDELLTTADQGRILTAGVDCVIAGAPNAGKSSLLNALLKFERAIVTGIPGTTTDTIEEVINIKGIAIKLIDTAGIRKGRGEVEAKGINRTKEAVERADIIIIVIDGAKALSKHDKDILQQAKEARGVAIVALNKSDIGSKINKKELIGFKSVHISALTGKGLKALEKTLLNVITSKRIDPKDALLISTRQKGSAMEARNALIRGLSAIGNGSSAELAGIDVKEAISSLRNMTGEEVSSQIAEEIFSRFCIGK